MITTKLVGCDCLIHVHHTTQKPQRNTIHTWAQRNAYVAPKDCPRSAKYFIPVALQNALKTSGNSTIRLALPVTPIFKGLGMSEWALWTVLWIGLRNVFHIEVGLLCHGEQSELFIWATIGWVACMHSIWAWRCSTCFCRHTKAIICHGRWKTSYKKFPERNSVMWLHLVYNWYFTRTIKTTFWSARIMYTSCTNTNEIKWNPKRLNGGNLDRENDVIRRYSSNHRLRHEDARYDISDPHRSIKIIGHITDDMDTT